MWAKFTIALAQRFRKEGGGGGGLRYIGERNFIFKFSCCANPNLNPATCRIGTHKLRLHENSNPGSTHFRSRTEFQSTNGCRLSQPGLQSGFGGVHTGGEFGLNLDQNSRVNGAIVNP